ncbi:uncharacterized protein LOC125501346 [Athalia rosae]|uniref:uncharacterized protein LOC125501346 n=1 Tax=Athalia rosae TaxID=37344 RepID=UPI002034921B|nr:uncharacterized protein LOC125501346 [Athalia rosae]
MKGKDYVHIILSIFIIAAANVASQCVSPSPLGLQLIMDYARWRSLDQLVIFDNLSPKKCHRSYTRSLLSCCGDKGMKISIRSTLDEHLTDVLQQLLFIRGHRVGSVIFSEGLNLTSPDNILQLASQKQHFNYYTSWLIVATKRSDAIIDTFLRILNIGIDSDVIVATSPLSHNQATDVARQSLNRSCSALHEYATKYKVPKVSSGVKKRENVSRNLDYVVRENKTISFYLNHVYKIRNSENSSLVVDFLGSWNPGAYALKLPVSVELRNNFHGFPLLVGILNSSSEIQTDTVDEEEMSDILPLLDIMSFVASGINASIELVPHEKLGTMTNKAWSYLLGDVVSGAVDIGLGNINVNDERQREMSFTHPIIQSMRNIYFHPPESGSMRDIFLQPFNNQLLGCVAGTCILIVLATTAINYAVKIALNDETETNASGLGEAALWCIGIMCMQGSPWSPRSPAGKTTLLISLVFALVIYNAYAGFITSILSVQAAGIKSLADLLFNNYKLGYSVSDDEYIRNANDSNLRELYIKAFNGREARLDTTSGLQKAAKGGYGFFVSARLARRALRTTLLHNRCSLKELIIPQTFTVVALPMAHTCPYKKIINHSVMRISEVGVLSRISERMLPGMPRCEAPTTFHSARLADVYSAFVILVTGVMSALTLGIFERVWRQRKSLRERVKRAIQMNRKNGQGRGRDEGEGEGEGHGFAAPTRTGKKFDRQVSREAARECDNELPFIRNFTNISKKMRPQNMSSGSGMTREDSRANLMESELNYNEKSLDGVGEHPGKLDRVKPVIYYIPGTQLFSPNRRTGNIDRSSTVSNEDASNSNNDKQAYPFHD